MGKPSRDYSSLYYGWHKEDHAAFLSNLKKKKKERLTNTKPSLTLKDYTGTYGGELYGDAEVKLIDNKLVLDFLPSVRLTASSFAPRP